MNHLGCYNTSGTRTCVRFPFTTHAGSGGNAAPSSAFEAADIRIYRAADGAAISDTQRSSAAGITMTSPFDTLTGVHTISIDLTDNTDAGFYAAGYTYFVGLVPDETIDSQAVSAFQWMFEIGLPAVNAAQVGGTDPTADGAAALFGIIDQGTAQSASSTTLVLRAGAAFADDTVIGAVIEITGGSAGVGQSRQISDYVSSTDTATVDPAWTVTPTGTITYKVRACPPASAVAPDVNVTKMNGTTLLGDGTPGNLFRV